MTETGRLFTAMAVFLGGAAVVYVGFSTEWAGTTMLALSAVLAGWLAAYLLLAARQRLPAGPGGEDPAAGEEYLPHASVWPFWVGLGSVVVAQGLLLGVWALVPGALLLLLALVGFAHQSRRRA